MEFERLHITDIIEINDHSHQGRRKTKFTETAPLGKKRTFKELENWDLDETRYFQKASTNSDEK
jgi:hypothetical protein